MIHNNFVTMSVVGLLVLSITLAVIYASSSSKESYESYEGFEGSPETFLMTPEGGKLTPQGAITGPVVITNQMTTKSIEELEKQAKDGNVKDTSCHIMGAKNNMGSFDDAFKRQLKVHEIQNKSVQGYQQVEDLKEISKNISYDTTALKGMFVRDGAANGKLHIDKYATVGVIDEKYLPSRGRPKELKVVGSAILIPGFDFDPSKALHSNGTGICPTGGVPGAGVARHRKRSTVLGSIANAEKNPVKNFKEDVKTKLMKANNVLTTVTGTD